MDRNEVSKRRPCRFRKSLRYSLLHVTTSIRSQTEPARAILDCTSFSTPAAGDQLNSSSTEPSPSEKLV